MGYNNLSLPLIKSFRAQINTIIHVVYSPAGKVLWVFVPGKSLAGLHTPPPSQVIKSRSNLWWSLYHVQSQHTVGGWLAHWFYVKRKSKDYVYGIWVYKVLGIWKGYYIIKKITGFIHEPWTEARNNKYMKYHSKLTYQLLFWNVSRKVDYHAGSKWFIHGPRRRKENQLLSLKHPCWLSLV